VVPVLIDQAERLTDADLPSDIMAITTAQFLRLDHRTVHPDMANLATVLIGLAPRLATRAADPPLPPVSTGPRPDQPWQGGAEIRIGDSSYLPHNGITEVMPADRSWVARQVAAERLEPTWESVLLRQVGVLRRTPAAHQRRDALLAEASLLTKPQVGLPRVIETVRESDHVTLVLSRPKARTLREVYGPTDLPLDHFDVADFLTALRGLCDALGELHWQKLGHRNLSPDVVLMLGDHVSLRDLGLATVDPEPGEGVAPYQAPEQRRAARGDGHASQIDVYQVAAIAYHVLTGHPPVGPSFLPVRATDPRLPRQLDEVLASALDQDPGRRPENARHLDALLVSVIGDLRNGRRK
jgi:serine/threonine protein kinase